MAERNASSQAVSQKLGFIFTQFYDDVKCLNLRGLCLGNLGFLIFYAERGLKDAQNTIHTEPEENKNAKIQN